MQCFFSFYIAGWARSVAGQKLHCVCLSVCPCVCVCVNQGGTYYMQGLVILHGDLDISPQISPRKSPWTFSQTVPPDASWMVQSMLYTGSIKSCMAEIVFIRHCMTVRRKCSCSAWLLVNFNKYVTVTVTEALYCTPTRIYYIKLMLICHKTWSTFLSLLLSYTEATACALNCLKTSFALLYTHTILTANFQVNLD